MGSFVAPFQLLRPIDVDPFAKAAEYQNLQALAQQRQLRAQQMQMGAIDLQQAQRELQDQQVMQQMLPGLLQNPQYQDKNGVPDMDQILTQIQPHISTPTWLSFSGTLLKNKEARANAMKAIADANEAQQRANESTQKSNLLASDYAANGALDLLAHPGPVNSAAATGLFHDIGSMFPGTTFADHANAIIQAIQQDPSKAEAILRSTGAALSPEGQRQRGEREGLRRTRAIQEFGSVADPISGQVQDLDRYTAFRQKYPEYGLPEVPDPEQNLNFAYSDVPRAQMGKAIEERVKAGFYTGAGARTPEYYNTQLMAAVGNNPELFKQWAAVVAGTPDPDKKMDYIRQAAEMASRYSSTALQFDVARGVRTAVGEEMGKRAISADALRNVPTWQQEGVRSEEGREWDQADKIIKASTDLRNTIRQAQGGNKQANASINMELVKTLVQRVTQAELGTTDPARVGSALDRLKGWWTGETAGVLPAARLRELDQLAANSAASAEDHYNKAVLPHLQRTGANYPEYHWPTWTPPRVPAAVGAGAGAPTTAYQAKDVVRWQKDGRLHRVTGTDPNGQLILDKTPLPEPQR